jgi:transposase
MFADADKDALIASYVERIHLLESQLSIALARIEELERLLKVRKTSENSSIPPSQDIASKNQSLREPSGKPSGGQEGHKGSTLEYSGPVDEEIDEKPKYCRACGADLSEQESTVACTSYTIDVKFVQHVTKRRHHRVKCTCGHVNKPAPVAHVRYGANVVALAVYLNVVHFLPLKRLSALFADVLGLPISQGTIVNMLRRCRQAAQPALRKIHAGILRAKVVGVDETITRHNGKNGWMWVFQSETLTYIIFDPSRGRKVLDHYFPQGLPDAIIVSDRYAAYGHLKARGRQFCLAHLLREAKYLVALEKTQWAKAFKHWLQDVFDSQQPVKALQTRLDGLLQQTLTAATPKTRTFLKSLQKNAQHLLTCRYFPKVPPDNNASERAIRNVKTKTKVSGYIQSIEGAHDYAGLRSIVDTAQKNGQSAWCVFQALANICLATT